jgi:hypothetical protein
MTGDEERAMLRLMELHHEGRIALVTSPIALEEIEQVPLEHSSPHKALYAAFKKIPTVDEQQRRPQMIGRLGGGLGFGAAFGGSIRGPLFVTDADPAGLETLLPDRPDALRP